MDKIGVHSIMASGVKGHGRQREHTETYRSAEYRESFVSKVRIELAVEAPIVDRVIETIHASGLSVRPVTEKFRPAIGVSRSHLHR